MTDYISRADELKALDRLCESLEEEVQDAKENPQNYTDKFVEQTEEQAVGIAHAYHELYDIPSADADFADLPDIPRAYYERIVGNMAHEINMLKEQLESADAVHGWRIGKPTEQGKYMVTLDSFGHKHIDLFYYGKPMMPNRKVRGKCWYRSDDEWGDVVYDDTDILAWQPLPKPYKGGDDK